MGRKTYFVQECPTCGRNLHVRIEYLGKNVVCQHCSASFEACDPECGLPLPHQSGLIQRVEELIAAADSNTLPDQPH